MHHHCLWGVSPEKVRLWLRFICGRARKTPSVGDVPCPVKVQSPGSPSSLLISLVGLGAPDGEGQFGLYILCVQSSAADVERSFVPEVATPWYHGTIIV